MIRPSRWRGAAVPLLALAFSAFFGAQARAEDIGVGQAPWVDARLATGTLTVKTWDSPNVRVTTTGRVNVRHIDADQADPRMPRQYTVWSQTVPTEHGDVALPEESFVLPRFSATSHDEVVARGNGDTTIMIPRSTALVTANVGSGDLSLQDYRGAFVAQARDGSVALDRVNGTGYVESLRGPVTATNSAFERLRVRTATGDMTFRNCTSHQIEASSSYGSIVYDNGKFQPGLAHFESVHGNVALGVRGGAQIGSGSGNGRIRHTMVRGGGPTVTAVSKHGNVYLYNGPVQRYRMQPRQYALPPRAYRPAAQYPPPPRQERMPQYQMRQAPPPGQERRAGRRQPPR